MAIKRNELTSQEKTCRILKANFRNRYCSALDDSNYMVFSEGVTVEHMMSI